MEGTARPWRAMAAHPLRFLTSSAAWRAWLYAVTGALVGMATLPVILLLLTVGMALSPVLVGLAVLVAAALLGIPVGAIERRRLRLLGCTAPPSPHRMLRGTGWRQWLRTRLREAATWRELGYTLLLVTGLWLLDYLIAALPFVALTLLSSPLAYTLFAGPDGMRLLGIDMPSVGASLAVSAIAVPATVGSAYLVTAVAGLRVQVVRALLVGPTPEGLDPRTMELVHSNGRLLDAFDAERQRIERDLHDCTQQRLVALTVMLDLARMRAQNTTALDAELPPLLSRAHLEAMNTLTELRELVQGIHPNVLTARGLPMAVAELVTRYPIPIEVRVPIAGRLPSTVESTAFFVISEALANIVKHANADSGWVTGQVTDDLLVLEVGDTGRGGVDPVKGTGIRGLADRVAAVGGRVLLSSPPGGPTVIRAEIPCLSGKP